MTLTQTLSPSVVASLSSVTVLTVATTPVTIKFGPLSLCQAFMSIFFADSGFGFLTVLVGEFLAIGSVFVFCGVLVFIGVFIDVKVCSATFSCGTVGQVGGHRGAIFVGL